MQKKEIEKIYIRKINQLKKHNEAYFDYDNPIISEKDQQAGKFQELFEFSLSVYLLNSR